MDRSPTPSIANIICQSNKLKSYRYTICLLARIPNGLLRACLEKLFVRSAILHTAYPGFSLAIYWAYGVASTIYIYIWLLCLQNSIYIRSVIYLSGFKILLGLRLPLQMNHHLTGIKGLTSRMLCLQNSIYSQWTTCLSPHPFIINVCIISWLQDPVWSPPTPTNESSSNGHKRID